MSWTAPLLAILILGACTSSADPVRELETRLYAPCCWRQTLADHESPLARELHAEITSRVTAGESADSIERSLVERYGDRIVASDEGRGYIAGVAAGGLALGLFAILWISRRRTVVAPAAPRREHPDDADRLDDELAAITD